jgi:hypothetical protein
MLYEMDQRSGTASAGFVVGSPARSRTLSITPPKAPSAAVGVGGADEGFRQAKLAGMASGENWSTRKRVAHVHGRRDCAASVALFQEITSFKENEAGLLMR